MKGLAQAVAGQPHAQREQFPIATFGGDLTLCSLGLLGVSREYGNIVSRHYVRISFPSSLPFNQ